jgi:hypothetical protein
MLAGMMLSWTALKGSRKPGSPRHDTYPGKSPPTMSSTTWKFLFQQLWHIPCHPPIIVHGARHVKGRQGSPRVILEFMKKLARKFMWWQEDGEVEVPEVLAEGMLGGNIHTSSRCRNNNISCSISHKCHNNSHTVPSLHIVTFLEKCHLLLTLLSLFNNSLECNQINGWLHNKLEWGGGNMTGDKNSRNKAQGGKGFETLFKRNK